MKTISAQQPQAPASGPNQELQASSDRNSNLSTEADVACCTVCLMPTAGDSIAGPHAVTPAMSTTDTPVNSPAGAVTASGRVLRRFSEAASWNRTHPTRSVQPCGDPACPAVQRPQRPQGVGTATNWMRENPVRETCDRNSTQHNGWG